MKYVSHIMNSCPMCGKVTYLGLSETQAVEFDHYVDAENAGARLLIQDALPSFDAFEREFVKTGYCPDCQKMLFSVDFHPSAEHKWICVEDSKASVERLQKFFEEVVGLAKKDDRTNLSFMYGNTLLAEHAVNVANSKEWAHVPVDERIAYMLSMDLELEGVIISSDGSISFDERRHEEAVEK